MTFILTDYIDEYIRSAKESDKKVALHLEEIIPKTTHMDKDTFNEIIEELKREMDNGKDFQVAFRKVSEKYILEGDIIDAELPGILIRIILNKSKFISYLKKKYRVPYKEQEIEMVLVSGNRGYISELLREIKLAKKKVVFSTFDEKRGGEGNPFLNRKVIDIINMLALNKDVFEEAEPLTAVKIRYKNKGNLDKKYPTFIDAGWNDKFSPAKKSDNYGRTRSLDPSLPNMPEIIHENLKMADILEDIEILKDKD